MALHARSRGALASVALAALLAFIVAAAVLFTAAERKLDKLVLGGLGESFSTKVYAAPFILHDQLRASPERVLRRLDRLGYRAGAAGRGGYDWSPPFLTIRLRGFETPRRRQAAADIRMTMGSENQWRLETSSGQALAEAALEPELAAELAGPQNVRRDPAEWDEIPDRLKQAVVSAEDKRFWRHWGIDPRAVARALRANLRRRPTQGGSTITQQLAKNLFLSPDRTLRRKAAEALLAVFLELRLGKRQILTLYLNHIYFGQNGPASVAGVKAAARHYFGKALKDLDLQECATLAGMIRSPYRYNPFRAPAGWRGGRGGGLAGRREDGAIGDAELKAGLASPLAGVPPPMKDAGRPAWFIAEVERELVSRYGKEAIFRYGLTIHTTMDPLMQEAAPEVLKTARPQAALVALDPYTGRVLALAGGRDFGASQFNRATMARRQPGSAFKPFAYGAALESGFTAASLLQDATRQYEREDDEPWAPENYDGVYHGTVTVREALAHSMNAATLDLVQRVRPSRVAAYARRLGVTSPIEPTLAIALGSSEVGLLELTASYAPFANGGFRVAPQIIESVLDADGRVLEFTNFDRAPAISPAEAYLMTSLLQTVVREGTGKGLAARGWDRPTAAKTGTTNDGRDAWFIGYTPELLAGVWVGDDEHRAVNVFGAKDALPVWAAFMKQALADYPSEPFPKPEGLVEMKIDPVSVARAVSGCPVKVEEVFLAGTEPKIDCALHPGGIKGWFQKLFKRRA